MNINSFDNLLHVRMFVLEVLRDHIKSREFDKLADKAMRFLMDGIDLPSVPERPDDVAERFARIMVPAMFPQRSPIVPYGDLDSVYNRYRYCDVVDPKNSGRHGIIVGFSREFGSLVALCDDDCERGVDRGDTDFVELPDSCSGNGFFYVSVEDVERQLGQMR